MLHTLRARLLFFGQELIKRDPWYFIPLSWLWGIGSFCKNALYDLRIFPVRRIPRVVVSIGNLVAGGTGKTPFVHLLASHFPHRKVAILSRGYGAIADEPLLLKRRLPHAQIYVGKNRTSLARKAVEEGAELLLLDDGFQYRKLFRDFDLVLLSGEDPFGKGHYLPRGFLRDSPRRLKKADTVFVTGEDLEVVPERILDLQEQEIPTIRDWKVGLFCGIAKPHLFKKTVANLGAEVVSEWIYADHGVPRPRQIKNFAQKCKKLGAKAILCTEKDFVKIPRSLKTVLNLYFLEISLVVKERKEEWEKLIAKIDQKIDNLSCDV